GPADPPYEEAIVGGRIIAGPQTWHLDNVRFDSGAVANGSFVYDEQPFAPLTGQYGSYSNIKIDVTSPNGTVRKFRIVNPISRGNAEYLSLVAAAGGDLTGAPFMALTPAFSMTNAGGIIDILPGPQNLSYIGVCIQANCGPADPPYEEALSGGRILSNPGPQRWYLEGVRFDSGAVATGYYDYDEYPYAPVAGLYGTYSNINIDVTSPNGSVREFRIVNPISRGNEKYVSVVAATGGDLSGAPFMALTPAISMTNVSGPINILPGPQNLSYVGVCRQANCGPADPPYEEALSGGRIVRELVPPSITSSPTASVAENQTSAIDVNATDNLDIEGNGLLFSLTGGADQAFFNIDADTGLLTFVAAPDYEAPVDAGGDNLYSLQVTVTDLGGLTAVQEITISVTNVVEDGTPPTANPTLSSPANAAGWHSADVTISWNWSDEPGGSGISPTGCTISTPFDMDGSFITIGVCSDQAGNAAESTAVSINLDKTPPDTMLTSGPPITSSNGDATFALSGSDDLSGIAGFECQLDNGEFNPCSSPQNFTGLSDGPHLFEVRAVDVAGNVDPTAESYAWTVAQATLAGSIDLQGRGVAPDNRWIVPLTVTLFEPGNATPAGSYTLESDSSGQFLMNGLMSGSYQIAIKAPFTLQMVQAVTLTSGSTPVNFGTLLSGDTNGDNGVNLLDFSILSVTFNLAEGDLGYDSRADFNGDGEVTALDFSILASNFNVTGEEAGS
ncbi:MAG: dockerin type I domain-containing protein, partial [Chloroflexota bacterium]